MKKLIFFTLMLVMGISYASAQGKADIKFDKTTHDFGKFPESEPVVEHTFTFTNVGEGYRKSDALTLCCDVAVEQGFSTCGPWTTSGQ